MSRISKPYVLDLEFRGFVEGLTYEDKKSQPLCHYFGGIPFALPPVGPFRFQKPRSLPPCYRYGTRVNPGRYTGGCGLCPQLQGKNVTGQEAWDEDCLQVNIWIPVGEPPKGGWPVLFYIHGGFLQFGSPNFIDPVALLSESPVRAIVVSPGHRLNVFGFLSSLELFSSPSTSDFAVNTGFWDQRLALEWTWQNISYFGGNASNITIAGYSAGSHSVFHQVRYDLFQPDSKAIIKRVMMLSNGPGIQPKSLPESQTQFEQLLTTLSIPLTSSPSEKLAQLRALPAKTLIAATQKVPLHQFRAVTDNAFVQPNIIADFNSGLFAARLSRRNLALVIGECANEHFAYGTWHPPASNSLPALLERLKVDYPVAASEALVRHYFPDGNLPAAYADKDWKFAFGKVYADIQVHALERGMVSSLMRHGAGHLVYRYRIEWRTRSCDRVWPRSWGATHASDMAIWFWGNGGELGSGEKEVISRAFYEQVARFVEGEGLEWGTEGPLQMRTLTGEGRVEIRDDEGLAEGLRVWDVLGEVTTERKVRGSKL